MAFLKPTTAFVVCLGLVACTDLRPGSDALDGGALADAADDASDASDANTMGCVPSVTSVDYPVIARGATLRITGTCLAGTTDARIASTSVPFTIASGNEVIVANLPDLPLGATSLVLESDNGTSAPRAMTVIALVVNEVDAKTASGMATDNDQFVEIGTGIASIVDLSGYAVVFVSGANDATYATTPAVALGNTGVSGTYVIGNTAIAARQATISGGFLADITNAHLVAVVQTNLAIGSNVPVASIPGVLLDAVVYSKQEVADDTTLLEYAFPDALGRVQWSETEGGATAIDNSVSRCATQRRSGSAFALGAPTPGATNTCP